MPKLTLDVDDETYELLAYQAVDWLRPVEWQAAVILRMALGLPFPKPVPAPTQQTYDRPSDMV
jgi:hypothetical protein